MTLVTRSRAFSTAFRETLAAHFGGAGGLLAGVIVAWQLGVFRNVPWILPVYFAVLTANGVINGLVSGRLNTALYIGTLSPSFHGSRSNFRMLFQPILAITLTASFAITAFSFVFGCFSWGIVVRDFPDILLVVLATMNLGFTLYLFNLTVAFTAFKKGLDLDSVASPIAATVADIFITACYAVTLGLFFNSGSLGKSIVILAVIVPMILMLYDLPRSIRRKEFVRTTKVSVLVLVFVAIIANITGTVLHRVDVLVGNRKEIFTALPAMIELIGDAGLIISSTVAARLALGLLKPAFSAMKDHALQISGAWAASTLAFIFFSASSLVINGVFVSSAFLVFTSLLLVANVIAVIAIVLISYALAVLTFHKGLDPDHLVIPIESSLAGTVTSIALFAALLLLRLI